MDNGEVQKILLISPYWREEHRWMISTTKLAELWQRLGYAVVVVCMGSEESGVKSQESPTLTMYRKQDFFIPDPWNYGIAFGFSGFVRRIIKDEKPDLIVINKLLFWTSLCAIPLRMRGFKVIQLTDALVGMTWWPRGTLTKVAAAMYAWTLGWLVLCSAHRVVFFHPQPQWLLKRLGIAQKCEVIPTGIDPAPYGAKAISHQPVVSSGQRPEARGLITVTYTGRLESIKGVDDFLAAVVPLQQQYPQMNIQVVGWYKPDHPLVAEYGNRVLFTGLRKDIPQILAQSDIFVLPSHSEGLSNSLMEAMASGCACVASDVGGNAYLIQNGVSGLLFPAGDRPALQAHVRRLLDDAAKRKAMGEAARKRIEDMFSWEIVGKRYQQLFNRYGV